MGIYLRILPGFVSIKIYAKGVHFVLTGYTFIPITYSTLLPLNIHGVGAFVVFNAVADHGRGVSDLEPYLLDGFQCAGADSHSKCEKQFAVIRIFRYFLILISTL